MHHLEGHRTQAAIWQDSRLPLRGLRFGLCMLRTTYVHHLRVWPLLLWGTLQ